MNSFCKLQPVCWFNLINVTLYLYLIVSICLVDCSSLRWLSSPSAPSTSDLSFQSNGDDRAGSIYNLDPLTKEWIQWRNMLNELEKQRPQSTLDSIPTNEKRGLDLGLRRGLSGQRAAKHLVGLANAEFAGGPGKKR